LTGSVTKAPATAKAGQRAPVSFAITNSSAANVAADGAVKVQIETSPDGLLADASVVDSITSRINLKPGKSKSFNVSLALNATSFVVVDVDPGNSAFPDDVDPDNNVFATSQAIDVA